MGRIAFETELVGDALNRFVAKLVKSFVRLGGAAESDSAESLDDFRYPKACFWQRKMIRSVWQSPARSRLVSHETSYTEEIVGKCNTLTNRFPK